MTKDILGVCGACRESPPGDPQKTFQNLKLERHKEARREGVELLKDLHRVLKNPPPPFSRSYPPSQEAATPPSQEAAHLLLPLLNPIFLRTFRLFLKTLPLFLRTLLLFLRASMHLSDSHRVSLIKKRWYSGRSPSEGHSPPRGSPKQFASQSGS